MAAYMAELSFFLAQARLSLSARFKKPMLALLKTLMELWHLMVDKESLEVA